MKILFMGTPDFAVPCLEALIAHPDHEVVGVVTQPDRPSGRGNKMLFSPVKECAVTHSIPVFQPEKIKTKENIEQLASYNADVFIVAAYGQLLSQTILDMPKYGCINVHASLLPRHRGASPIQHAITSGDTVTGVTIMQMDKGLDTGDMLLKGEVPITAEDTGGSLHDKLAAIGGPLLIEALAKIADGTIIPEKQDNERFTYAPMLSREDGHVNWHKTSKEIIDIIRGFNPWPGTFTMLGTDTMKIWAASHGTSDNSGTVGEILESSDKKGLLVQAKDGTVWLTEIQMPGKKRMKASDYLRGNSIAVGSLLS